MPISTLTFAAIDNFTLADGMAVVLWLAKLSFAVLGGADFGAGVWDLLAGGETKEEQRGALIRAIGPIWEANEIWLIFLITGAWTGFPLVFGSIMATMFVPLTLGLLGIVMRGAGFAIYSHFRREVEVNLVWGRVFSIPGTVTPFFFGAVAAAVASGQIHVSPSGQVSSDLIASWTTPFALACGCFAVALCACLAATYMTEETRNQGELRITRLFRRRALSSGSIAALIGVVAALIARSSAPYLFNGLTTRALPLALAGVVVGVATAVALVLGFYAIARLLSAGGVALLLGAWAVAQLPYVIVPYVKITDGSAPSGVQAAMLIATVVSMALVLPAFWYLMYLFKAEDRRRPPVTTDQMISRLEAEQKRAADAVALDGAGPARRRSLVRAAGALLGPGTVVVGAAVTLERLRRRLLRGDR